MLSERTGIPGNESCTKPFRYISINEDASTAAGTGGDAPLVWNLQGAESRMIQEQKEKEVFERGLQEGESRTRVAFEKQLASMRAAAVKALEGFKAQREEYFARVEPEIVQLSLAMARKILHREAQIDPLLLAGMVRVALEKIDAQTRVRLRAHPADVQMWKEYFAQHGALQPGPELVGDGSLQHGECALETEMGSTQISLDTQLKEIEQGFFDLLEQRPRMR
jgi:flagellar assembly protein FliH